MKIAIIRRNGLGDLLTTQPLILLCKKRYPGCHITLFVDARNADLVPYLQGVDESVVIEVSKNKYISLFKTLWKNRPRTFDWAISARPKPMQWVNLMLSGIKAKRRRAVAGSGWHTRWIDEPQVYAPDEKRHQMVKTLQIVDPSIEEVPKEFLPSIQVEPNRKFDSPCLLVSVSNHRIGSQLDSDKIAEHLNRAFQKKAFQVVLSCGMKDLSRAEEVKAACQMPVEIAVTPKFDDFMTLLSSVDGSWTGDGGIMHLMAAMHKPQLVLFGRTPLWEWAPISEKARCIWHPQNVNDISQEEIQQSLEALIHDLW